MPGIELPAGIKLLNPSPVDTWSGPYSTVDEANHSIPLALRYKSMIVRIVTSTSSDLYWYRNGTADTDLVLFNTVQTSINSTSSIETHDTFSNFPQTNQSTTILYIATDTNIGYYWNNSSYVPLDSFTNDITVSLPTGKSFGKYQTGDIIHATGKTPQQVIFDAIYQAQNPTPSLSFSPISIPFNSSSTPITITIARGIHNIGATVQSETLTNYNNVIRPINNSTATDTLSSLNFRTTPFTYTYNITDSNGSSASITANVPITSYQQPTLNLSVNTVDREIGDISTDISGSITTQSTNVPLSSYTIEYKHDNLTYTYVDVNHNNIPITGNTYTITNFTHNPTELINTTNNTYPNSITYRLQATDLYRTSLGQITSQTYTINFYPYIYYGSFANINSIVTSGNSILPDGSNINTINIASQISPLTKKLNNNITSLSINTGTTNTVFVISLPAPHTTNSIRDNNNNNIISAFLPQNSTLPYNKTITTSHNNIALNYNIYIMTVAQAYSISNTFSITIQ